MNPTISHAGIEEDRRRLKQNRIDAGKTGKIVCDQCGGTGNRFYFMYSECPKCKGTGLIEKNGGENVAR